MRHEAEQPLKIGIIGAERFGGDQVLQLKEDTSLNIDFLIFDKKIRNRQEFLELLPSDNLISSEAEFFKTATSGIILADFLDLKLNKYRVKFKKTSSFFCSAKFLCQLEGLEVLFEIAENKNILVCFDLPFRFTRGFMELDDAIKKGRIGKIHQIDLTFYQHRKFERKPSGNSNTNFYGGLMETGVHLLDMALKVLNYPKIDYVEAIPFKNGKKVGNQSPLCEDYILVTLLTKHGTCINLRCSRNLPVSRNKIVEADFHGEKGDLCLRNNGKSEEDLIVQEYKGEQMNIISSPPDIYLDAALREWIWKLKGDKAYNKQMHKEMLALAKVVDKIYYTRPKNALNT